MPDSSGLTPQMAMNMPQQQQAQPPAPQGIGNQGYDPYNNQTQMGLQPPPTEDDAAGSVPATTAPGHAAIIRAMHNAYSNKGVNPYASHPVMKKKWERAWKDKANRDALKAAKMEQLKSAMPMLQKVAQALKARGSAGSPSPVPASPIRR